MRKIVTPFLLFIGFLLLADDLHAQEPRVGDQLSALELEEYLQAPKQHYHYEDLEGQALVLQFWAPWNAPSIKSIFHLNTLSRAFKTKPVRIISITYEDRSLVEHFLERHPIEGWVGLDDGWSTHEAFGISDDTIPRTVLIDPSGKIAAITRANKLNTEILEKLIRGDSIAIQTKKVPTYTDSSMINTYDGIYSSSSTSVNDLLQIAYRCSPSRIIAPDKILNTRLNISIRAPETGNDEFYTAIQNTLKNHLGIKIKREIRNTDVYVLTAPDGVTKGLRIHNPLLIRTSKARGVIAASGAPVNGLTKQLEEILEVPIVNKTNFTDSYAWAVTFDGDNPTSLVDAVKEQLGLNLELEKKDIEMLIVKSK